MQRVTLIVVVEGQSESGFLKPFLAEHLALRGIDLRRRSSRKGRSTRAHAPRLGAQLDLASVRAACPRFAAWLTRLESLAR